MKIFHLSHIDLDGYGCQLITSKFFNDIHFFNANYGREVGIKINLILDMLSKYQIKQKKEDKEDYEIKMLFGKPIKVPRSKIQEIEIPKEPLNFLILITDLNLTPNECKYLSERVRELKVNGINVNILLLDHHITGEDSASSYSWYNLDSSRCATKITYEYMIKNYQLINKDNEKWLNPLVEMINSVDIWVENGFGFEFGKVAMNMISSSNEINKTMFETENRNYKLQLLESAKNFLAPSSSDKLGGLIEGMAFNEVSFDNELFFLKKEVLKGNKHSETMDTITSKYHVELLSARKESCKIYFEDKVGFLSYNLGGISVVANKFLNQNSEFDFFIDVGLRGNVSLRSNGKCDVSLISQNYFNGGGHKNASGGRIDGFKESFVYEDIRLQVQDYLKISDELEL